MAATEDPAALLRVILIENLGRSRSPTGAQPAQPDPDTRIDLDVPHPVGVAPALRDEPECLSISPVAHRRASRQSGAAPDRLQQGVARDRDPKGPCHSDDRVDHRLLHATAHAAPVHQLPAPASVVRNQAAVSASDAGASNSGPSCPAPPTSSNRLCTPALTSAW